MLVQFYNDGPPRLFEAHNCTMLVEINTSTREETDETLRKLRLRRRGPWTPTEWGWEARYYHFTPHSRRTK